MKKLIIILFILIFSANSKGQATLSFTNTTGTSSITCIVTGINILVGLNNNFNQLPLTYTWNSNNTVLTGSNVIITSPGSYSVVCYYQNAVVTSTTIIIGSNYSTINTGNLGSQFLNITCNLNSVQTITSTPAINGMHNWVSPQGATLTTTSATFIPGGPGTYTHFAVNMLTGCAGNNFTFSVFSNQGYPTFNLTSPQQFNIGCTSNSLVVVNIINAISVPPSAPLSYTILPPNYTNTLYLTGSTSSYSINTPGIWTVITKDNSNSCETKAQFTITQNTLTPNIIANTSSSLICVGQTATLSALGGISYTWNPGSISGSSISITPSVNTTYTVTGLLNGCTNKSTININASPCTTINENNFQQKNISIYPNPSNNNIQVNSDADFNRIEIVNNLGQLIISEANAAEVSVKDLSNGIYFIHLFDAQNKLLATKKFIKE
jgi:hypothetical protein